MSSQPIKQKQLKLKASKMPDDGYNDGFVTKKASFHKGEDWGGEVKGKTKHTYEAGD